MKSNFVRRILLLYQINKYGFISLKQPKHDSVWFPNNESTTIYGYLTNLPGNVYFRETKEATSLESVTRTLEEKNLYSSITNLLIVTYSTTERPDSSDSHLHANDFQIVIAERSMGPAFYMVHYQRLDTLFGVAGVTVPACYVFLSAEVLHSQALILGKFLLGTPGSYGYPTSVTCRNTNTGKSTLIAFISKACKV